MQSVNIHLEIFLEIKHGTVSIDFFPDLTFLFAFLSAVWNLIFSFSVSYYVHRKFCPSEDMATENDIICVVSCTDTG